MNTIILSEKLKSLLSPSDEEFFYRVWNTDQSVYISRLKAIGFQNFNSVLDAGCGFGQWSVALSTLNSYVYGFDNNANRISVVNEIKDILKIQNASFSVDSIERTSFPDNFFDAVFCYGVIMFSDYREVIKEFLRILKSGGKVYICTNGLGWYLYNLIDTHNSSENFDSRQMAIDTIKATLNFYRSGVYTPPNQILIPSEDLISELVKNNFKVIQAGGEGTINLTQQDIRPFFRSHYYNEEGVYEVLAEKL